MTTVEQWLSQALGKHAQWDSTPTYRHCIQTEADYHWPCPLVRALDALTAVLDMAAPRYGFPDQGRPKVYLDASVVLAEIATALGLHGDDGSGQ